MCTRLRTRLRRTFTLCRTLFCSGGVQIEDYAEMTAGCTSCHSEACERYAGMGEDGKNNVKSDYTSCSDSALAESRSDPLSQDKPSDALGLFAATIHLRRDI